MSEHLFISDLRKHPDAEVRLIVNDRTISGTLAGQVTASIDALIREAKTEADPGGSGDGPRFTIHF